MEKILYKAETRGHNYNGWLDTYNTFSYAGYFDPERINFGALRVVNDDTIKGGEGFGSHPHNNIEIVSIPLCGALEHRDNLGHVSIISPGDVQVLSAGSGVVHSIHNADNEKPVSFFQIWVLPKNKDIAPKYEHKSFNFINSCNELVNVIAPNRENGCLYLNQDVWFSIGTFTKNNAFDYRLQKKGNGLYAMVVEGKFDLSGEILHHRDGIGIFDTDKVKIRALSDVGRILLIDVTMKIEFRL
ncbi:MAG: pirin family protein [Prevotellaceae bacterium]|jgi:redox-sensitive bicupin YhaK (pirin superfamily)|nr:pirin family protein [Prevotellaceae bacterium]